jgi:hypothetical protein
MVGKIGSLQSLACIGLGAALGLMGATGLMTASTSADGARQPAATASPAGQPGPISPCCVDGLAKNQLLALAAPEARTAESAQPSATKKPNIVVIWGDDIGTWNIGAYTHGMMGRTPSMKKALDQTMKKLESSSRGKN